MVFRVAVTTTADRAAGMSAELVAAGLVPVSLPCVRLVAGRKEELARAKAACEEADLVVLPSSRPIRLLWPHGDVPEVPVAVNSPATEVSVSQLGITPTVIGNGHFLSLVRSLEVEGLRVAVPHAADVDPMALAILADRCEELMAVPVCTAAPVAPELTEVDGAVFASPAAVHGWALSRSFKDVRLACMGSAVVNALTSYGRDCDVDSRERSYSEIARAWLRSLSTDFVRTVFTGPSAVLCVSG